MGEGDGKEKERQSTRREQAEEQTLLDEFVVHSPTFISILFDNTLDPFSIFHRFMPLSCSIHSK